MGAAARKVVQKLGKLKLSKSKTTPVAEIKSQTIVVSPVCIGNSIVTHERVSIVSTSQANVVKRRKARETVRNDRLRPRPSTASTFLGASVVTHERATLSVDQDQKTRRSIRSHRLRAGHGQAFVM